MRHEGESDFERCWRRRRAGRWRSALAACGGDDGVGGGSDNESRSPSPARSRASSTSPTGSATSTRARAPIDEFEAKYPGSTVNYTEDVNDNAEFFGKLQPLLDQGESGGRSMFVVTDWMAKQMYDLGYLQEIDYADVPNVDANLKREPAQPGLRPGAQVLDPVADRHDRPAGRQAARRRTSSRSTTCSTRKYKGKVTC